MDSTHRGQSVRQPWALAPRAVGSGSAEGHGCQHVKFRFHGSEGCRALPLESSALIVISFLFDDLLLPGRLGGEREKWGRPAVVWEQVGGQSPVMMSDSRCFIRPPGL